MGLGVILRSASASGRQRTQVALVRHYVAPKGSGNTGKTKEGKNGARAVFNGSTFFRAGFGFGSATKAHPSMEATSSWATIEHVDSG